MGSFILFCELAFRFRPATRSTLPVRAASVLNPVFMQSLMQSGTSIIEDFENSCESFSIRPNGQVFGPSLSAINQGQHVRSYRRGEEVLSGNRQIYRRSV